jgi:23S rRNA (adenine-N6)-dimethyltransferase
VPYHITAELVRGVFASMATEALLIVQAEAAEKLTGAARETRTALLRKPWWQIEVLRRLERSDFVPAPAVDSVLLRLHRREQPLVPRHMRRRYEDFVLAAFGSRRQRARDALRQLFTERQLVRLMHDLRIPRDARASQISFPQWLALFRFHTGSRIGRGGDPQPRRCGRSCCCLLSDVCCKRGESHAPYRNMSRSASRTSSALVASSDAV